MITYLDYGSYSGASETSYSGSISLGASMSSATSYYNAANHAVADVTATQSVGDLVKSGAGTLTLGTNATYAGSTIVNTGTLALTSPVLPDAGTLSLATGAMLNLNFLGSDTVNQLRINGVAQAPGTWGSLTSDATNKTALITGTGILNVLSIDGMVLGNSGTIGTVGTTLTTGAGSTSSGGTTASGSTSGTTVGSLAGIDPLVINGGVVLASGTTTLLANPISVGNTASVLTVTNGTLNRATLFVPTEGSNANASQALGGPAPVPEPSSAILALVGAAMLSLRRRRV
ncbi:MAG: autotransporter-associated beta strand repeat-containing protein [Chthoniobacteraceae bacterium]